MTHALPRFLLVTIVMSGWVASPTSARSAPELPSHEEPRPRRSKLEPLRGLRAVILGQQAAELFAEGKYEQAIPLKEEECAFLEENLSPRSRILLKCLTGLATIYRQAAALDEAEAVLRRILAVREGTLDPDEPRIAQTLNGLAGVLHDRGAFAEAEPLFRRALAILDDDEGGDPWERIACLANLAMLRLARGDFHEAESLLLRTLSLVEEAYGAQHPAAGSVLGNLGELERRRGRLDEAELLLRRALAIREATLPADSLDIVATNINLAAVYFEQGAYERAQELLEHSLARLESTVGRDHPTTAVVLNNLAAVHFRRGELAKAEELFKRSLVAAERRLGAEHPEVVSSLCNLAYLLVLRDQNAEAEVLLLRALSTAERALGPEHPQRVTCLNVLASSYVRRHDLERAAPLYRRALSIAEKTLGPHHREVSESVSNLGIVELGLGRIDAAVELQRRALDIEETNLSEMLTVADDSRRLEYAVSLQVSTHYAMSLHMRVAPDHIPAAALALDTVLRRKGRAQDLAAQSHAALRRTLKAEHHHLFDDLQLVRAEYAALARRGPSEEVTARLTRLQQEQDRLWAELHRQSPTIRELSVSISVADVQQALPLDSALVELVWYFPMHDETKGFSLQPGEPRYAAYLVFPDRFTWVDLGSARIIDERVAAFRRDIQQRRPLARDLYESIIEPLEDALGSTPIWFIAPDGALNLIPFAAIHDGERYLVERHTLRYLTTGRDLLTPAGRDPAVGQEVLVVANPTHAGLPGAELEAEGIASLFPGRARTLVRDEATTVQVADHPRPWILHVATHGFFGTGEERGMREMAAENLRSKQGGSTMLTGRPRNPMLYSGLQLAPSPRRDTERRADDGLLTSYEVSGWDLRGTELVVLSACDTGLGTLHAGEGVLGLRRAFAMTGAETQVVSLWKVSDAETAALMDRYYRNLLGGMGRAEAMQQTQLDLLHGGEGFPKDWASFIVVGAWTPLTLTTTSDGPPAVAPGRGCTASVGGGRVPSGLAWFWGVLGAAVVGLGSRSGRRNRPR